MSHVPSGATKGTRGRKNLDLPALAEKLGRDHRLMRNDLTPKLRCSACQGKNIALTLSPPGQPGAERRPPHSKGV